MGKILLDTQTKTSSATKISVGMMLAVGLTFVAVVGGFMIMLTVSTKPMKSQSVKMAITTATPTPLPTDQTWYLAEEPWNEYAASNLSVDDNLAVYCRNSFSEFNPINSSNCIASYAKLSDFTSPSRVPLVINGKQGNSGFKIGGGYLFWQTLELVNPDMNTFIRTVYARPLADINNINSNIVVVNNEFFGGDHYLLDVNKDYILVRKQTPMIYQVYAKPISRIQDTSEDAFQAVPGNFGLFSKDYIVGDGYEEVNGRSTHFIYAKSVGKIFEAEAGIKKISMETNEGPYFLVSNQDTNLVAYTTDTFSGKYELVVVDLDAPVLEKKIIRSIVKTPTLGFNFPHGVAISDQYLIWYEGTKIYYMPTNQLYAQRTISQLSASNYKKISPNFSVDRNWLLFIDRNLDEHPRQDRVRAVKLKLQTPFKSPYSP